VPNLPTGKIWVGDGNTTVSDVVYLDEANGRMGIGTTSPSTPLHINADAPTIRLQDATSGDNHYFTGNNGELRVQTSGYMTMRPGNAVSTTFLANGNVGIGTTSPSQKLHVFNAGYPQMALQSNGGTWQVGVSTGNDLAFRRGTSGSNYPLWLDSSDNVGIGTTSPGSKLEVQGGDIEVDDSASGLILKSPDGTRYRITVANGGTLTVTAV
jgi:hypothetical protein